MRLTLTQQRWEQVVATSGLSLALLLLAVSWKSWLVKTEDMTYAQSLPATLEALSLVIVLIIAYRFPIHFGYRLKFMINTAPVYLMAVLLPPALAATAAGLGTLAGQFIIRSKCSTKFSYIANDVARYMLIALLGGSVAHFPASVAPLPQVFAAFAMFATDALTTGITLASYCGQRPWRITVFYVREGGLAEGAQYLLGLLAALAAAQQFWFLALLVLPMGVVYASLKRTKEMQDGTRRILETMADNVDLRDPYTGGHSRRVTELCVTLLQELIVKGPEADLVIAAARVHDIGKIGTPDSILNKPGKLTPEERKLIEAHSEQGAELLRKYPDFARGAKIVLHHHESWDGTGYPHRLRGTDIPFGSRVIAVADSFDAMTSDRPYRKGMTVEKAASILKQGRGQQWDPNVVDAFLQRIVGQLEAPVLSAPPLLRVLRPLPADPQPTTTEATA